MKCEKCGGNLTLEDVACPHCEAINEHAVQHIREMNRYKKDYEGTRKEVYSVTKAYAGLTVRIVILAVLVVLTIVCGVLSGEVYSIRRHLIEVARNDEECREQIEQYLKEREYYALAVFCDEKSIDTIEEGYEDYYGILYAAGQYRFFYDYVMYTLRPYEGSDMQTYADRIAELLSDFYKVFDESHYCYVGTQGKQYQAVLEMQEQMNALLVAYCGVTPKEAEAFPTMTNAQRALAIEEGIANE